MGNDPGCGCEEAEKQLGSDDQIKQSSRTTGSRQNRVGEYDETGEQPCAAQANEDIRMGGQVIGKGIGKPRKKSGQPLSDKGMSTNGNEGGQLAQVILLSPSHTNPRLWVGNAATSENLMLDDAISGEQPADGKAAHWLKRLLPESQSGWWEVGFKGKGFTVKFRWRDTSRQTLLFPQITGKEFRNLRQSGDVEASIRPGATKPVSLRRSWASIFLYTPYMPRSAVR